MISARLLAAVVCALTTAVAAQEPITTGSLIAQMSDLQALTRAPLTGERVVQFSSYDRRSSIPGGPGWFDNSDGFGSEPIPNFEAVLREPGPDGIGEYLICDVRGPGAIVRTWTATIEGSIRLTLDGSTEPAYDGPAAEFLMHRAAALAKLAGAEPAGLRAFEQRYADYYPVPFSKSCRIVWTGNWKRVHFYHAQVRTYPAGTPVVTFDRKDPERFRAAAAAAERALTGPPPEPDRRIAEFTLAPGASKEFLSLTGPAAITRLDSLVAAGDVPAALRGTVLRLAFDGFESPQVAVPIGDFFGAAPGVVPYNTFPMSVAPDGLMISRFVMPFQKTAVVSAENRGSAPVTLRLGVATSDYQWDDRSMHFRVRWRADHDLTARGGKDAVDLPFLLAHGRGVYVGTAVYLMSPCPVPTAGGNWWGEGDEKIFVDGEARPSIFGTGSEDYFNYAWSEADIFQYPYFSQPICSGPETRGYITNNRWHILDAIPFDRSISFFMELYSHSGTPHLSYARAAYWYARPGAFDSGGGLNDADLRVPPLLPWTVRAAGGAKGATLFEAETVKDPASSARVIDDVRYSAGRLVQFAGPTAALRVNAEKAGRYRIVLTCVSGPRASTFSARINDTPLRSGKQTRFELMTPYLSRLVNLWFEPVELPAGDHVLTLEGIGTDGGLGVDFVWLKPVE